VEKIFNNISITNVLKKFSGAKTTIITNQSAFGLCNGYHFRYYQRFLHLIYIGYPEHGLFGELQDQEAGDKLKYELDGIEGVNLYGKSESSLHPDIKIFQKSELILIDIRDVGCRYFTFMTTCLYVMEGLSEFLRANPDRKISFLVIDSPNPAGKKIEGSELMPEFESFIGVAGIPNRHGLTPGQLLHFYYNKYGFDFDFSRTAPSIAYPEPTSWIPPSPNIPQISTCEVYSGQCLLEGTNLSEGRGTTRPFEIFGAPYIDYNDHKLLSKLLDYQKGTFQLRPLLFIPTFNKYKNVTCDGFQLIISDKDKFHSLFFGLYFIRIIQEYYSNTFEFRKGPYEKGSDKTAIELLVGDTLLLEYLRGKHTHDFVIEYLTECEANWKIKIKDFSRT